MGSNPGCGYEWKKSDQVWKTGFSTLLIRKQQLLQKKFGRIFFSAVNIELTFLKKLRGRSCSPKYLD